jgi:hypothetical protein
MRDEFVNALDQMLKNFHLDNNQSKNQSKNSSYNQSEKIQLRQSDRKRRVSKLAEKMIQYDSRKKMPRADMIIRDKFSYKKILKCLTHITRVLATLNADQSNESQIFRNVMQRFD